VQHGSVEWRIVETTHSIDGKALSPPDFWRSGAFTAWYRAGSEPHLASGLLQPKDKEFVDGNYNLSVAQKWLTCSAGGSTTLQDPDVRGGKEDPLLSPGIPLSPAPDLNLRSGKCPERCFNTGMWDPLLTCFRCSLRSRQLISNLEGGLWYLGLAPKFLMHALVTGSLHRKKVFIEAMQPFPVEQLDNRSVCSQAGLIKARTVTTAQEL
jgi:hypothetical protein